MSIRSLAKTSLLTGAKWFGGFSVAAARSRSKLRVLCYHGISIGDEHAHYPGTFMRAETFRRRLELLRDWGANFLSLEAGIEQLYAGSLPEKAVVVTIDDGWFGTFSDMRPLLAEFGVPATLYVSSYYVDNGGFVFNLFVDYALRTTTRQRIDLSACHPDLAGEIDLASADGRERAGRELTAFGENNLDAAGRQSLCERIAAHLDIDAASMSESRMLQFMNASELEALAETMDLQLHTHTHRFSLDDREAAKVELDRNLESLGNIGHHGAAHFCYPSGRYVEQHAAWLQDLGIKSATTTDFGLASPEHSPYYLPRICDSDDMSELDFMAAVSGFKDLYSGHRA